MQLLVYTSASDQAKATSPSNETTMAANLAPVAELAVFVSSTELAESAESSAGAGAGAGSGSGAGAGCVVGAAVVVVVVVGNFS